MNRRAFLGALLGTGAAVATEAVAPSLVWPFRKYFLPSNWMRWVAFDWGGPVSGVFEHDGVLYPRAAMFAKRGDIVETSGFVHSSNNGIFRIDESKVEALELETFAKEIPDLLFRADPMHEFFKSRKGSHRLVDLGLPRMPLPFHYEPYEPKDQPVADAANVLLRMVNGNSIEMQTALLNRAGIFPEQPKRGLLHQEATVKNIVRFVDELQSKS